MNDVSEDNLGDNETDFGYSGFKFTWVEYPQIASVLQPLLAARSDVLVDVQGVLLNDEWAPTWPLVLCFGGSSVYIHTKCIWWWTVGTWHDYPFFIAPEDVDGMEFRHSSLVETLQLDALLEKRLSDVSIFPDFPEATQGIVLGFGAHSLAIEDDGDQLGVRLLDHAAGAQMLRTAIRIHC